MIVNTVALKYTGADPAEVCPTFTTDMVATFNLLDPHAAGRTSLDVVLVSPSFEQALLFLRIFMLAFLSTRHSSVTLYMTSGADFVEA